MSRLCSWVFLVVCFLGRCVRCLAFREAVCGSFGVCSIFSGRCHLLHFCWGCPGSYLQVRGVSDAGLVCSMCLAQLFFRARFSSSYWCFCAMYRVPVCFVGADAVVLVHLRGRASCVCVAHLQARVRSAFFFSSFPFSLSFSVIRSVAMQHPSGSA